MITLNYEDLISQFDASLVNNLRLTGVKNPLLELWVPDGDPLRSVEGLVHSISQTSRDEPVVIELPLKLLSDAQQDMLLGKFPGAITFEMVEDSGPCLLTWTPGGSENKTLKDGSGVMPVEDVSALLDRAGNLNAPRKAVRHLPTEYRDFLQEQGRKIPDETAPSASAMPSLTCRTGAFKLHVLLEPQWNGTEKGADHPIETVTFEGAEPGTVEAGLLSVLAQVSNSLTLSELADHGTVRVIEFLADACPAVRPDGIAASLVFTEEMRFLTGLLRQLPVAPDHGLTQPGFSPAPAEAWMALSQEARLAKLRQHLQDFCDSQGLRQEDVVLDGLVDDLSGWPVRVVVTCGPNTDPRERPGLVRQLEHFLKGKLDRTLIVLYEAAKDSNKIRRL